MDNQLSKYQNRNLKDAIASLHVVQGTAKDTGNIYYAMEIEFVNNYKKRIFLRSDEQFAWCNAFDMLDTENQINVDFK